MRRGSAGALAEGAMRIVRALGYVCVSLFLPLLAAAVFFLPSLGREWLLWFLGCRVEDGMNALLAGDTSIDQAQSWMTGRWDLGWHAKSSVFEDPVAMQALGTVFPIIVLATLLSRIPISLVAAMLARRAIRRDDVRCSPPIVRGLGRNVYLKGLTEGTLFSALVAGVLVAVSEQLRELNTARWLDDALKVTAATVFLVLESVFALVAARRIISRDITGRQCLCRWCGQDLQGFIQQTDKGRITGAVCPECGRGISQRRNDAGVRILLRPEQARWAALAVAGCVVLVVGAWGAWAWIVDARVSGVFREVRERIALHDQSFGVEPGSVRVWLPVERVMSLQYPGGRALIFVGSPLRDGPAEGAAICRMLEWRRSDASDTPTRTEGVSRVTPKKSPVSAHLGSSFPVSIEPEWMTYSTGRPGRAASMSRTIQSARLIVPAPNDPEIAWLTAAEDEQRLKQMLDATWTPW